MAIKILQIDLQNDITPQIGSYDNAGGVTPNNWRNEDGVYSLGPTNGDGRTPYYWFTPTREVTDFDLCWEDYQDHSQTTKQYHLEIGDSAGNVVLSALRQYANYDIGPISIGNLAYRTWHKILVEVRKASASSSTVTVYVDGRKVATGTSNTLLTSAKIALLGHVPNILYMQNAGQRLRYVTIYDRSYASKGINLDGMMTTITTLISKLIAKLSTVAFTGSYNDLSNKPTISTVNDGTLTIQKNGTNVQTFKANQSTNATANITVPTKTSDLTNDSGFITSDNTKIPLAGSNQISGSLIPSTDNSIDIGSSTKSIKALYTKDITIDGTQFLPSDYIPRSGGAVITGSTLARSVNNSDLNLCGGDAWNAGASIILRGKNHSAQGFVHIGSTASDGTNCSVELNPWGYFQPGTDNAIDCGASARRWKTVYAATGTINTSDSRYKNSVKDIDDKLLDAWENIEPKQYKFNDATEKKGEKARYHTGYLAQDIQAECEKQGANASDYGLFCYDEWDEQEEVSEEIETEKDGKKVKEKRIVQPKREKGNLYALRYEEALVVECKYLRRCIERLTTRIEELEKGKEQEAGK